MIHFTLHTDKDGKPLSPPEIFNANGRKISANQIRETHEDENILLEVWRGRERVSVQTFAKNGAILARLICDWHKLKTGGSR